MEALFAAFGIDWRLLLIQALNFGLLLVVLSYFLYKPLLKIIDDRREKIAEGVRTAEAASRRLAEAEQEGKEKVGEAARQAETLLSDARARAEVRESTIVKEAETRAASLLKDAETRAEESKRQAMLESQREIAKAAMLAAEKILREKNA